MNNQERTISGKGEDHEGSFLAEKILKDVRIAAFEHIFIRFSISTLRASQHLSVKALIRALFSFEIKPLADTSTEN